MPEEPTDEEAKTLSRRLAENLRKEQRAEAQSRKTRRVTIPTVTEMMEARKEDGTRQSTEDTGGAFGIILSTRQETIAEQAESLWTTVDRIPACRTHSQGFGVYFQHDTPCSRI